MLVVEPQDGRVDAATRAVLTDADTLTRSLGGTFLRRAGDDAAAEIVREIEAQRVTQLVLGAGRRSGWRSRVRSSTVDRVLRGDHAASTCTSSRTRSARAADDPPAPHPGLRRRAVGAARAERGAGVARLRRHADRERRAGRRPGGVRASRRGAARPRPARHRRPRDDPPAAGLPARDADHRALGLGRGRDEGGGARPRRRRLRREAVRAAGAARAHPRRDPPRAADGRLVGRVEPARARRHRARPRRAPRHRARQRGRSSRARSSTCSPPSPAIPAGCSPTARSCSEVWGDPDAADPSNLRVFISALRRVDRARPGAPRAHRDGRRRRLPVPAGRD